MTENFPESAVLEAVSAHVDVGSGGANVERCRTGKFNATYFVQGPERGVVIRIAPPADAGFIFYEVNMMAQELGLHELVRARTDVPVPEILAYDTSRAVLGRDFLIMERLPGVPLTEAAGVDADPVWGQVGAHLAEVHAITADAYGYLGPHRVMEPQGSWAQAFHIMWNKLVDDIVACGGYSEEEAGQMRSLADRCMPWIDREVPACLLHMDVWHQNVLVTEDGAVTGLLDWDRALWGDPEIEFAVLDYCGVSVPAFWEGYGSRRDRSDEAKLRQAMYFLYELQKYIVIRRARGKDPSAAEPYRRNALGMAAALFDQ